MEDYRRGGAIEWQASGCHLIKHAAEAEQVGPGVHFISTRLLRGHVSDRADGSAGASEQWTIERGSCSNGGFVVLMSKLSQAEIEYLGAPAVGYENICRLDIAMNDALAMRGIESVGNLNRNIEMLFVSECFPQKPRGKWFAFEKLHRDERLAVVFGDFVDGADVLVIDGGCSAGFHSEALE